ncbi:MAG: aspartate/glutamate racemase family protein [Candidatus Bipolaricaulaceae bacterium]
MIRVGLVRVISDQPAGAQEAHARLMEQRFPRLSVITRGIRGFPHGLSSRGDARRAVPAVVETAAELAPDADVLAVSCTQDPGLPKLRQRHSLPVTGAGAALAWACRALGRRIGLLGISPHLPGPLAEVFSHGPRGTFVWRQVDGVERTTDLPAAEARVRAAAEGLVNQGCTALALACTGFSTLGIAPRLARQLGVPVLDPVVALAALISAWEIPTLEGGDHRANPQPDGRSTE